MSKVLSTTEAFDPDGSPPFLSQGTSKYSVYAKDAIRTKDTDKTTGGQQARLHNDGMKYMTSYMSWCPFKNQMEMDPKRDVGNTRGAESLVNRRSRSRMFPAQNVAIAKLQQSTSPT